VTLNRNDDEVVEVVEVVEVDDELDTDRSAADENSDEASTAEIRGDIEETRAELGATLGELGSRLDPQHVMEQAKENVREATIGRVENAVEEAGATAKGTADMVMQTIRENPIPAALAGTGLFLLWRNRSQGGNGSSFRGSGSTYRGSEGYGYADQRYLMEPQSGGSGIASSAKDTAANAASKVGSGVENVAGSVGEGVGNVANTVGQGVGSVADTVGQGASQAIDRSRQTAYQIGSQLDRFMQRSPLAMGAVAAGLGAVVGAMVPETAQEREVLGDATAKLGNTMRETVDQAMDKVEEQADKVEQQVSQS
jgi:hypothetical protein